MEKRGDLREILLSTPAGGRESRPSGASRVGVEEEYRKSTKGLALLFAVALGLLLVAVAWHGLRKGDSASVGMDEHAELKTTP